MTVLRFPGNRQVRPGPAPGAWPVLTLVVLVATGWVFGWQLDLGPLAEARAIYSFGLLPAHLFGLQQPAPQIDVVPPVATLLTAQFLHGGWSHVIGNLLVLLLLGPLLERRIGALRFLMVYLAAGAIGLAVEAASAPSSVVPIIGASASIAGVIGGLARVDPRARIALPAPRRSALFRLIRVPALPIIATWLVIQVYGIAFADSGDGSTIAFLAHGAGFVAGVLLVGAGGTAAARGGPPL